jgi:hypothetical protein
MDYGEPEGVALLKKALKLHGAGEPVRIAVSAAVARIGGPEDYAVILSCLELSPHNPAPHLSALEIFLERYPEKRAEAESALPRPNTKI